MRLRFTLLKATYEWLLDAGLTPYFLINARYPKVHVPEAFVEEGQIVLDASVDAVENMHFDQQGVSFDASFNGEIEKIFFPISAIDALYAEETEQGLFMTDDAGTLIVQENSDWDDAALEEVSPPKKSGTRGHLKLVK